MTAFPSRSSNLDLYPWGFARPIDLEQSKVLIKIFFTHAVWVFFLSRPLSLVHGACGYVEKGSGERIRKFRYLGGVPVSAKNNDPALPGLCQKIQ